MSWDPECVKFSRSQECLFDDLVNLTNDEPLPSELPLDHPVENSTKCQSTNPLILPDSDLEVLTTNLEKLNAGLSTARDFYKWFSNHEDEISRTQLEEANQFLSAMGDYQIKIDSAESRCKQAESSLDTLEEQYIAVSQKTGALHDACEQLLRDQTRLTDAAENIKDKLSYFNEYNNLRTKISKTQQSSALGIQSENQSFSTRVLNQQVDISTDSIVPILSKIDSCMEYCNQHGNYLDASNYMRKYKDCLKDILIMIKDYVLKNLERTTQKLLNRNIDTSTGELVGSTVQHISDDAFTLYYGRFRTDAPKIRALVEQLEQRETKNEEYQLACTEIYKGYCLERQRLLQGSVSDAVTQLALVNKGDHCALVRAASAFMLHVCEDEHQLWKHFFTSKSPYLNETLERLCQTLYDLLRPKVIHIYHLETLGELCSILKIEMLDEHVQSNKEEFKAFEAICKQMLEDVQERLVYRTNIYIKEDVLGYVPGSGDVMYPEKLEMMQQIQKEQEEKSNSGDSSALVLTQSTSAADIHGMWYPTVRRVLVCLSKLYRCIEKPIFQGLSQEALSNCVTSLNLAADKIKLHSSNLDAVLFLIKHLLILREQISPFQADFSVKETSLDFARTKNMAMRFGRKFFNKNADDGTDPNVERLMGPSMSSQTSGSYLMDFLLSASPEVKEYLVDSKKEVARHLKINCEQFITDTTNTFTVSLKRFLTQANAFTTTTSVITPGSLNTQSKETPQTEDKSLPNQAFAKAEKVHEIVDQCYKTIKKETPSIYKSLSLYLAQPDVEQILFKPVRLNVLQVFQQLVNILQENYTEEDQAIIAVPSQEQLSLLLSK